MISMLRELWRDIDKCPPHAPPGCETGGQVAFVVWFGGWGLFLFLGFKGLF